MISSAVARTSIRRQNSRPKIPVSEQQSAKTSSAMSSLLNRLKGLQAEVDVPLTDMSHLSLTDLEQQKVSFG